MERTTQGHEYQEAGTSGDSLGDWLPRGTIEGLKLLFIHSFNEYLFNIFSCPGLLLGGVGTRQLSLYVPGAQSPLRETSLSPDRDDPERAGLGLESPERHLMQPKRSKRASWAR